tara:strand:+ start:393 stop:530 length:138 start_codon:yes stop_codon:yes gene_type:complete
LLAFNRKNNADSYKNIGVGNNLIPLKPAVFNSALKSGALLRALST